MAVRKLLAQALLAVVAGGATLSDGACAGALRSGPPSVAFFGFHLINTSLEPTSAIEDERIRALDEQLREKLSHSGRFTLIEVTPAIHAEIAAGPWIGNCNGCEISFARRLRTEVAAWGTVQKVSNLILNINLYMKDVETGEMTFVHSVDIRGNTDVSWRRGLDYMLQHYLFPETSPATPGAASPG